MSEHEWIKEFPAEVIVCDGQGNILGMNDKAAQSTASEGGYALIGKNVLDCHPGLSRGKVEQLLTTQEKKVYTVEQNSIKKLIYQSPWYKEGQYAGLLELSLEIPLEMEHFVRS